jgi:aminocarboxymuconate-semialdehyde decarboxylase
MTIVDMHAHYMSPRLIAEAERNGAHYGVRVERNPDDVACVAFDGGPLSRPFFHELCDLAHRIPAMDAAGIAMQVLSTWTDVAGDALPAREAARWVRMQNDTLAEDIHQFPGRFAAMATLPLQDVDAALVELDHVVDDLGIRSVELVSSINGRDLDHPDFQPLWQRLEARNVFVFLHPPLRPVGLDRTRDYFLNNLISFPTDTTIAAARLMFGGVMDAFPGLKIGLAHSGGVLPFLIGRFDLGFAKHPACSKTLTQRPSDLMSRFVFDTLTHHDKTLAFVVDMVGADNMVYGTDYPFEMMETVGPQRIARLPDLSDTARNGILGDNIHALLSDTPRRPAARTDI